MATKNVAKSVFCRKGANPFCSFFVEPKSFARFTPPTCRGQHLRPSSSAEGYFLWNSLLLCGISLPTSRGRLTALNAFFDRFSEFHLAFSFVKCFFNCV
ncbi:MAG: hypothetical protein Q4F57_10300, partial [Weeksellaceae bacterium]|nr:hypothetical protein [Weeksellaceae bacterium]